MKRYFLMLLVTSLSSLLYPHFSADTLVTTKRGSIPIKDVVVDDEVLCCEGQHYSRVTHTHRARSKRMIILFFDSSEEPLRCSPDQKIYAHESKSWVESKELKLGESVSCNGGRSAKLSAFIDVPHARELYDITVEPCHTLYVTQHEIKAHNVVPFIIGAGWVFGAGAIEFSGITLRVAALGTIIGCGFYKNKKTNEVELHPCVTPIVSDSTILHADAKAPGKPTKKDGFIPKKNWDGKKVRNPNGAGYGWPDEKGWVCIPTGPKGHGGPHWDVEGPNGEYKNIVPGGKILGQK